MSLPEWKYRDKAVTEMPEKVIGFVYKITYKDFTCYYGKITTASTQVLPMLLDGSRRPNSTTIKKKIKLTKEELDARTKSDTRTSKLVEFEVVIKTKPAWKKYVGSGDTPDDSEILSRTILYYSTTKRTLTYLEAYVLMSKHAAVNAKCHNKNILGSFYDNALDGYVK